MNLGRWLTVAFAGALITASACAHLVEPVPERFEGVYFASTVRGAALPYTANGVDSYVTLVSDSLQFFPDGRGLRTTVRSSTDGSSNPPVTTRHAASFDYRIEGRRLYIMPPCDDASACAGLVGEINVTHAYLAQDLMGLKVTVAYLRGPQQ